MTNRSDREPNEETERMNLSAVLVDSAECGVVIAGAETRLVWLNTAAERMIGIDAARLLSQPIDALPEPLAHVVAECFARRVHISDRQVLIAQPGGDVLLEVQSIPVAGAKDDSATVVVLLRDLSASRRLEDRIRQLDRLADVGALSADVAHEVKNALVAIKTFTELVPSSNKDEEARALVKREVQRIDSLVSQLLRFAAPAKPGAMRLSAHEVIDNALRPLLHRMETRGIRLQKDLRAQSHQVRGSETQLAQALVNLVLNAIEAMESGGTLTLSTDNVEASAATAAADRSRACAQIQISIQDTGAGILPEHLTQLFLPFFTTKPEGTGLGLAITRRIIREHGGAISVQSEPGQGTRFLVELPLAPRAG